MSVNPFNFKHSYVDIAQQAILLAYRNNYLLLMYSQKFL